MVPSLADLLWIVMVLKLAFNFGWWVVACLWPCWRRGLLWWLNIWPRKTVKSFFDRIAPPSTEEMVMKTLQYRTWHRSIQSFQNTIRMVRLLRLIQWLLQSYLPFIQFMIFYHAFRCMSSERVANSDCFQFFPVSSSITFVTDRGPPKTDMP